MTDTAGTTHPSKTLPQTGTSAWLDDLSRVLVREDLASLIKDSGVVGVTSNPTIFATALEDEVYDDQLGDLKARGVGVDEAVRLITAADVRSACDAFTEVFKESDGLDGLVSLEVDPRLAHDEAATLAEAKALRWLVDRENLLVKVPATDEGVKAFEQLTAEGLSVNVTLVFSLTRYAEVVQAYLNGLERAAVAGIDLSTVRSVASFFVSRVDAVVNRELEEAGRPELRDLVGVANAQLAYAHHLEVLGSERWEVLEAAGARPQRPLWASTGVKEERLVASYYAEALAGPGVVNTMPRATLLALEGVEEFQDRLSGSADAARAVLAAVEDAAVDVRAVTSGLEAEGVRKFKESWEGLLASVSERI